MDDSDFGIFRKMNNRHFSGDFYVSFFYNDKDCKEGQCVEDLEPHRRRVGSVLWNTKIFFVERTFYTECDISVL